MSGGSRRDVDALRIDYLRYRSALRDPTTGLHSYGLYFDRIREFMSGRQQIGVVWAGLGDRRISESVFGWQAYDQVIARAADYFRGAIGRQLHPDAIVATTGIHADSFVIFVPADHDGAELDAASLARLASEMREEAESRLDALKGGLGPLRGGVRLGASLLADNPFHRFERCVHHAVEEARQMAVGPLAAERLTWMAELQRVVRERDVRCCYQRIVDLEHGSMVGVEAFARGPDGSALRLPRVMFALGREAGLTRELDRICRIEAIRGVPEQIVRGGLLLFLNTAAENLADPEWSARETAAALSEAGLEARQIVLDIPERQVVGDPELYRGAVDILRERGFQLSLDDLGSGPRSLLLVEALKPEFMKFDLALVRHASKRQLSRELLQSLVALGRDQGARLIVERVETAEEEQLITQCGARWGQGYLFGIEDAEGAAAPSRGAGGAHR